MTQDPSAPSTTFDAKSFLEQQSNKPGVYQMFDDAGKILYVGKAKALKNRLKSYFGKQVGGKTRSLVGKIQRIEVTVTETETEALLLEQNLIKQQKPPYNILLRDDKSYPYIYISTEDRYPRIDFHRGPKRLKGRYFGPYPSSGSVRETLQFLQKTFRVRQCEDAFFRNRSRPCLQYQIHRCTAPCVEKISTEHYAEDVKHAIMFLEGNEDSVMQELANRMESAAGELAYEQAAAFRDQITHIRHIQEPQSIEEGIVSVDVMAVAVQGGSACIQMITVRHGRILGSRSYFPAFRLDNSEQEILAAFIAQHYLSRDDQEIPKEIVTNIFLGDEEAALRSALEQTAGRKIQLSYAVRSQRAKWQELALRTAKQNLLTRLATRQNVYQRFERLQEVLQLESLPERIECFDISHSSGEATVASCVVFDINGPVKADYRRFNIDGVPAGDDYGAMRQALMRRYTRIQNEQIQNEMAQSGDSKFPDLLLIDGGKGQYTQAEAVLAELQISAIQVVAVAKGSTRKAGFETLVSRSDSNNNSSGAWQEHVLDSHDAALHLIQQIRDEAHRFAVTGHKQRRDKKRNTSVLESIPGIGAKRRRELLRFFGGQQEIARAGVDELLRVPGINQHLAQAIYDAYHDS